VQSNKIGCRRKAAVEKKITRFAVVVKTAYIFTKTAENYDESRSGTGIG